MKNITFVKVEHHTRVDGLSHYHIEYRSRVVRAVSKLGEVHLFAAALERDGILRETDARGTSPSRPRTTIARAKKQAAEWVKSRKETSSFFDAKIEVGTEKMLGHLPI